MPGVPACPAALVSVGSQSSSDPRPGLAPAVGADHCTQCDHGIDMNSCPMHAAALQPCLDHYFVGALRTTAADRVAGCLERGVLHLHQSLVKYAMVPSRASAARIGSVAA